MNGYTKLFNSIVTSTIWTEDDKTRIVWITMLAIADKNGEVQGSIPGLARIAGVAVEDCRTAIVKFLSPDPDSRTKDDEGRRIESIDGGWLLLNHQKYREMASRDEQRESEAKRKARYRDKLQRNRLSQNVPDMSQNVPDMSQNVPKTLHIAEAKVEAKADIPSLSLSLNVHPEERERARGRADTPIEEIQKRINDLKREWGKPAHWSYTEQYSLQGGTATQIGELSEEDWSMLKSYLNAYMPEGGAFWQPRSRSKFVETFADTFGHAVRWAEKTGNSPKPQKQKDGWK